MLFTCAFYFVDIIDRILMDKAPIIVSTGFCEDGCELTLNWTIFVMIILMLILFGLYIIYYIYREKQHPRRINEKEEYFPECEGTILNLSDVVPVIPTEIHREICLFSPPMFRLTCIASVNIDVVPTVEINKYLGQVFSAFEEQKLICYCDGSYSHDMQIGYAGFRASNGAYRVRFFSPDDPRCGSTDTEVLAACLAIQYALEKRFNTLIIYTDNSKVEQLLKRPKEKDNINYPYICQILHQYQKQNGNNAIQVIRVRGHTSICEQQKCHIKLQFAKIDRTVRRKTRQYIRKRWIHFEQNYYHWYKPAYYSYYT